MGMDVRPVEEHTPLVFQRLGRKYPTGCATRLQQADSVVRNGFTSNLDYIACPAQNHSRIFHTRTESIPGYAWVVFLLFFPGIILVY